MDGPCFTLGRRQLYMLPTRYGLVFSILLFVLLLASINYSNGLAYGLTFLLASLGVVSMFYTHRNLHLLDVSAGPCPPVFTGEQAEFSVNLQNPSGLGRFGVTLESETKERVELNIAAKGQGSGIQRLAATSRGYLQAPAFRLSTTFPLGLLYSWSRWMRLHQRCLVYPRPAPDYPLPLKSEASAGEYSGAAEGDDFFGLREFRPGDSPRHVSWKAAARGQGMYTKIFAGNQLQTVWLDWDSLPTGDTETRLSQLCRGILQAEQWGLQYGLRLPHLKLAPNAGGKHQHECLKALALFPQ